MTLNDQLRCFVVNDTPTKEVLVELATTELTRNSLDHFEATISGTIPTTASANCSLLFIIDNKTQHRIAFINPVAATLWPVAFAAIPDNVTPPRISSINKSGSTNASEIHRSTDGAYFTNSQTLRLVVEGRLIAGAHVGIYRSSSNALLQSQAIGASASTSVNIDIKDPFTDGRHEIYATIEVGSKILEKSQPAIVNIRGAGPKIDDFEPRNLLLGEGRIKLRVFFNKDNPLDPEKAVETANYVLTTQGATVNGLKPSYSAVDNAVLLEYPDHPSDGTFTLQVNRDGSENGSIVDLFGNKFTAGQPVKFDLIRTQLGPALGPTPGITSSTGKNVAFPEFAPRPEPPPGFNPNDRVETRVARLYYFRDAHRVAQIINRNVKSYNRQAVDVRRQLADKSRAEADQRTIQRQEAERSAIAKAEKSRQTEQRLRAAENSLNSTLNLIAQAQSQPVSPNEDAAARQRNIDQLQNAAKSFAQQVDTLQSSLQLQRDEEVRANEAVQQKEAHEKLAREEQFRREVAAAHTDPDTYVPGEVESRDPVEQVSVSVIGEGLIQLRGPLKGVNQIRIMIDQIDAPVGQVRMGVHTVQINGERAERMERVADHIQKYIDQARFLTMQSAELLRRSVVQVASQKAEEARGLYAGETQEDRDQRYLYAFFGRDFIDELRSIDSEFLRTGNKLLSLHSMDTTSLSSALTLMALAKNDTRTQILSTFETLCQGELPRAEESYLQSGMGCCDTKHCQLKCKQPKLCLKGQNARFESLRGFFTTEISHDDTVTPLQREFLRLAQIFKSRLITEIELKQRVMERSVIEERFTDRREDEHRIQEKEKAAKQMFEDALQEQLKQTGIAQTSLAAVLSHVSVVDRIYRAIPQDLPSLEAEIRRGNIKGTVKLESQEIEYEHLVDGTVTFKMVKPSPDDKSGGNAYYYAGRMYAKALDTMITIVRRDIDRYDFHEDYNLYLNVKNILNGLERNDGRVIQMTREYEDVVKNGRNVAALADAYRDLTTLLKNLQARASAARHSMGRVIVKLSDARADPSDVFSEWLAVRGELEKLFDPQVPSTERDKIIEASIAFETWVRRAFEVASTKRILEASRHPLDHKKFLDMLIDETEEKYIELLEGTRAHTANVDNYIKRITTALDDDFNTQFYYPVFRNVREASQFYDVQFGQTESTTLLVNNREFGKVSPSATMEFDLPARDILISEAINGAKAMVNDVGALANDPTFLAMAKMKSPNPVSGPAAGSTQGLGGVRSVLPGLNGQTSEQILSQNANGGNQFGSNLENLIPDPSIYKFETGTGYEIRPVIQPDGQAVVFHLHYMYTTNIREPVRADEKHLGRVKRHFIDTDVQLSNFELREVSRYVVALKAARTAKGVPLLEDIPLAGVLFRPLPSDEKSLQQNLIMAQATIFPTLFDLMGLRWAPAVADLDALRLSNDEFTVRGRNRMLKNRVYDYASEQVDEFLRIPQGNRRPDLYRSQETVPHVHPNGYQGPGLDQQDSELREGYQPNRAFPSQRFVPAENKEGSPHLQRREGTDLRPMSDGNRGVELIPPGGQSSRAPQRNPQSLAPTGSGSPRMSSATAAPQPNLLRSVPAQVKPTSPATSSPSPSVGQGAQRIPIPHGTIMPQAMPQPQQQPGYVRPAGYMGPMSAQSGGPNSRPSDMSTLQRIPAPN